MLEFNCLVLLGSQAICRQWRTGKRATVQKKAEPLVGVAFPGQLGLNWAVALSKFVRPFGNTCMDSRGRELPSTSSSDKGQEDACQSAIHIYSPFGGLGDAEPVAYRNSQARIRTQATAVTPATAVTMPDP